MYPTNSIAEYVLSYSIHDGYDGKCLESGYITVDTFREKIFNHDVVTSRLHEEAL